MYTLKRAGDGALLGPVNKRVHASFAPKRHAFAYARREADKRGFTQDSGKTVQLVTDGHDDFAYYAAEYFPDATHTIDIIHVTERLWAAGQCLYNEGSDELKAWVDKQRARLYEGEQHDIVAELLDHYDRIPLTGPGNKGKRLEDVIRYLEKRRASGCRPTRRNRCRISRRPRDLARSAPNSSGTIVFRSGSNPHPRETRSDSPAPLPNLAEAA